MAGSWTGAVAARRGARRAARLGRQRGRARPATGRLADPGLRLHLSEQHALPRGALRDALERGPDAGHQNHYQQPGAQLLLEQHQLPHRPPRLPGRAVVQAPEAARGPPPGNPANPSGGGPELLRSPLEGMAARTRVDRAERTASGAARALTPSRGECDSRARPGTAGVTKEYQRG